MKQRLILLSICSLVTILPVQAAISIHFEQIGFNVVATTYGSVTIPSDSYRVHNDANIGGGFIASATSLYAGRTSLAIIADSYSGVTIPTPLAVAPTSTSFEVFGFAFSRIYIEDETQAPFSTYSPTGTMTWNNTNIATVFGGIAPAENVLRAFELANFVDGTNTNYIEYVIIPIPEPSLTLLFGLGTLGLAVRRSRNN